MEKTYSIVIPVYNSSPFLEETVERIISSSKENYLLDKIILVDDGSKDNSWKKILELKSQYPEHISGIKLSRNFGQHNATCAGIAKAKSDFIITMDDDLETAPEDAIKLIESQVGSEADVVYGKYKRPSRNLLRKAFKLFYEIIAKIVGGDSKVNGSSFRLIKTELAKEITAQATNFVFIDEVIFWFTNDIKFVDIKHYQSRRERSHYSFASLLKLGGEVVLYSSQLPLKAIKIFGFLMSMLMFIIGAYFFIKQLLFDIPVQGFTALIVTITASTGIIMFTLGVIGEYLGKLFRNSNNSPVYSVREEI